jgi:hypothetical protein
MHMPSVPLTERGDAVLLDARFGSGSAGQAGGFRRSYAEQPQDSLSPLVDRYLVDALGVALAYPRQDPRMRSAGS